VKTGVIHKLIVFYLVCVGIILGNLNYIFLCLQERYDTELRSYLKTTGLHASDLVKPKARRREVKPSTSAARSTNQSGQQLARNMMSGLATSSSAHDVHRGSGAAELPNFSQAWTPQQLLAQMGLSAAGGQTLYANADGTISSSVVNLLTNSGGYVVSVLINLLTNSGGYVVSVLVNLFTNSGG